MGRRAVGMIGRVACLALIGGGLGGCSLGGGTATTGGSDSQPPEQHEIGTERFVTPLPPGWRVVRGEQRGRVWYYRAEPEKPVAADRQDQILTTVFLGRGEAPVAALESVAKSFATACESLQTKPPEKDKLKGLDEASQLILCGKVKNSDRGMIAFERMIRGEEGLYYASFQVRVAAFDPEKGPPLAMGEFRVLTDFLAAVTVCDLKRAGRPCPRGEAPPTTRPAPEAKPAETPAPEVKPESPAQPPAPSGVTPEGGSAPAPAPPAPAKS